MAEVTLTRCEFFVGITVVGSLTLVFVTFPVAVSMLSFAMTLASTQKLSKSLFAIATSFGDACEDIATWMTAFFSTVTMTVVTMMAVVLLVVLSFLTVFSLHEFIVFIPNAVLSVAVVSTFVVTVSMSTMVAVVSVFMVTVSVTMMSMSMGVMVAMSMTMSMSSASFAVLVSWLESSVSELLPE